MLAIVGTVPDADVPVIAGTAALEGHQVSVAGHRFAVNRGTPALLAATIAAGRVLNQPPPMAYLAGDIGRGDGSRKLYAYLTEKIARTDHDVMVFHYLQPDVDWHNRVLFAVQEMAKTPTLIADAGFMYVAKMSGQAGAYDLFTPDIGELSFLADEMAPHPFYTRGFILHMEARVPEMIAMAYRFDNAAKCLLVKGRRDYVADRTGIRAVINEPSVPTLEPIGGTGDTVTGIAAALVAAGIGVHDASEAASRINRLAGLYARPTPATQVTAVIDKIARATEEVIEDKERRQRCP
jgi:ADP-dependent NAD(P)H-hydrate dehydratase / NAD(P)H-hydrate epimerase